MASRHIRSALNIVDWHTNRERVKSMEAVSQLLTSCTEYFLATGEQDLLRKLDIPTIFKQVITQCKKTADGHHLDDWPQAPCSIEAWMVPY